MTVRTFVPTKGKMKKLIKSDEISWSGSFWGRLSKIFTMSSSAFRRRLLVFAFPNSSLSPPDGREKVTAERYLPPPQRLWCKRELYIFLEYNKRLLKPKQLEAKSSWEEFLRMNESKRRENIVMWLHILIPRYQSAPSSRAHSHSYVGNPFSAPNTTVDLVGVAHGSGLRHSEREGGR